MINIVLEDTYYIYIYIYFFFFFEIIILSY